MNDEYEKEPTLYPNVPLIDIIFSKGTGSYTSNLDKTLTISHPELNIMMPYKDTTKETDRYIRSAQQFQRKINKNIIYINFPIYESDSGGYGYDLGFLEDTFTFTIITSQWKEYERISSLVKANNGEISGVMHIGVVNDATKLPTTYPYTEQQYTSLGLTSYNVIVRTNNYTMETGKWTIGYDITVTVVYKKKTTTNGAKVRRG